ncbi:MAG: hypothetical protein AAF846_27475 [Chloroflexota bacterium]
MVQPPTSTLGNEGLDGNEAFEYYELADLETMTLAEIEQIWDLVPTEDRDYLTRRYRKSVKTHGISSDEQEIQMADQYLQRYVYEGLVPAGDQWVRISASRRQQLKSGQTDLAEIDDDDRGSFPWMNALIIVFGLFLAIFVISRIMGSNSEDAVLVEGTLTPTPTATMTFTPSPTPTITPTPTTTPIALIESDSFIEAGDGRDRDWFPVQVQVRRPDEIQPRVFIVQERAIDLTEWSFDNNPDVASWISGTVVRPVFGIPYSETNERFLNSLLSGTEFSIRMNTGSELQYTFSSAQELGREDTSLFRQNQPGIVLVLIGEIGLDGLPTSSRYFVTGTYNPSLEVDLSSAVALPIAMGQTVDFPDLSIQVDHAYTLAVPDAASDDFMYAILDLTLTANANDVALSNYQWFLDARDARYSPDLSALISTTHPLTPAILLANQSLQVSIPFLVHRFDGNALLLFSPPGVAGESFSVTLTQPTIELLVEHLDIQLRRIRRSDTQIYVDVRVYNPQADAITLELDDIGMIFGFRPMPTGATSRPLDYQAVTFDPDYVLDLTLAWDWNADDPFARLDLAGRVWSIALFSD